MPKKYIVKLTSEEKQQLLDIIKKGKTSAREIRRAHTLLMASSGKTDEAIAKTLQVRTYALQRNLVVLSVVPKAGNPILPLSKWLSA